MNQFATVESQGESKSVSRHFSLRERILLSVISWAAALLIRIIGVTLRYSIVAEEGVLADGHRYAPAGIYCFWHRSVIPAAWRFRNMQIAIMISRSFDGELIARTVERLGFRPVRGSSSRGGAGALLAMREELELGHPAVFTADGPRGPIYVAKPGPIALAKKTGHKITAFYVAVERAWILNSWDKMIIPKPFSRALVYASSPFEVPADATDEQIEELRQRLDRTLEHCRREAEKRVKARQA